METCSLLQLLPQFILGNGVLMQAGRLGRGLEENPDGLPRKLNIYLPNCSDLK